MKAILTLNAGSSSIKFSLYTKDDSCQLLYSGAIREILTTPVFRIQNAQNHILVEQTLTTTGHNNALAALVQWIESQGKTLRITAIGHRIVHGGQQYTKPIVITKSVVAELEKLIPLAPLHQPYNVEAIKVTLSLFPKAVHIACFDTAFHTTNDALARHYALPRKYTDAGIMRYGFHGLSYEYIASTLPNYAAEKSDGKVVVAHLGNGASMCAMRQRKSVATTMGFTALEGMMMGTRAGSIDPGIILYLQQHHGLSVNDVERVLYKESGLLGVSGISHDVKVLQDSMEASAKDALALFCYRAAQELAMLAASLQGLDILVFTAGIGENSVLVRRKIGELSAWLGIHIDETANTQNKSCISLPGSSVAVYVIPTNEEWMIAKHTLTLITDRP